MNKEQPWIQKGEIDIYTIIKIFENYETLDWLIQEKRTKVPCRDAAIIPNSKEY